MRLVKDTHEYSVNTRVGVAGKITDGVGVHQGLYLSPHLFDMILNVMALCIKQQPNWCTLFADDILLCSTRREHI